MKVMKIDYGNVEIGKTATKTIEIWNESYVNILNIINCIIIYISKCYIIYIIILIYIHIL